MVRMIYKGNMAFGKLSALDFELVVRFGETYDIPERLVTDLLKGGEWFAVEEAPIEKKVRAPFIETAKSSGFKLKE